MWLGFTWMWCFSLSWVAGHSGYEASEEIATVVKDVGVDLFNGVWCFYLFCVSKADKHTRKDYAHGVANWEAFSE